MTNGTARRVIAPRYGGPEVLEVVEEEVTQAGPGQVTIEVRAAGLNPADYKMVEGAYSKDPDGLPVRPGYEVAGVIVALGADTEIASGGGAIGDAVLAFRVQGGYAATITVPASSRFAASGKSSAAGFAKTSFAGTVIVAA
jgi:NADPH2:quinone reductase